MTRQLALGASLVALTGPVLYLYVWLAASGGPAAGSALPLPPASPAVVAAAFCSFLLGWAGIAALSFPHPPAVGSADMSRAEGGMPIIRRQVRVRWAESANPAA